jgi:transketolase
MKSPDGYELPMAEQASRVAAGHALVEVAEDNSDVFVLTADVMLSTGTEPFARAFPQRFLNVGVAEQTLVGVAAGLATCGKIPVAATFAFLASMRACEQVRTDVAYPNLNVKIYATHAGVALGKGGTTHHATEDIAIMRGLANMTILVPADVPEIRRAIPAAIHRPGPVYIRLRRGLDPIVHLDEFEYEIGKARLLRQGRHVTLVGCGRMVAECLIAAESLAAKGIEARVLNMHTIKPLDREAMREACCDTELITTVEDHNIVGGLGSAVAEAMAEMGTSTRLQRLGFADRYAGIGPEDDLLDKHGLSGPKIAQSVVAALGEKGQIEEPHSDPPSGMEPHAVKGG